MAHRDPYRQALLAREHYARNRERVKAAALEWKQRQRPLLTKYVRRLKEKTGCRDCGAMLPHYQLTFDHLPDRGQKRDNIADMIRAAVSMKTLLEEIAKCEIVCGNCHLARTWFRLQESGDSAAVDDDEDLRLFV